MTSPTDRNSGTKNARPKRPKLKKKIIIAVGGRVTLLFFFFFFLGELFSHSEPSNDENTHWHF